MLEEPLPHYNDRKTPIDMLMFHCSALKGEDILQILDKSELSCHYIINEKGELIQVVEEDKRAYHAGIGFWNGIDTDLNSHSIGIEISNLSMGQEDYKAKQIKTLVALSKELIAKYNIRQDMIVGHSDTAPNRKPDPGKAFPWKDLSAQGIGLWFKPSQAKLVENEDISELLASIGYDTRTPEMVYCSAYAFCRRFAPQYVKTDEDIAHLVDHVLPDKFDFMDKEKFIQTLKAVSYSYQTYRQEQNLTD